MARRHAMGWDTPWVSGQPEVAMPLLVVPTVILTRPWSRLALRWRV